jgi:hypothetical protein
MLIGLLDVIVLGACAFTVCLGATMILGDIIDAVCDLIERLNRNA